MLRVEWGNPHTIPLSWNVMKIFQTVWIIRLQDVTVFNVSTLWRYLWTLKWFGNNSWTTSKAVGVDIKIFWKRCAVMKSRWQTTRGIPFLSSSWPIPVPCPFGLASVDRKLSNTISWKGKLLPKYYDFWKNNWVSCCTTMCWWGLLEGAIMVLVIGPLCVCVFDLMCCPHPALLYQGSTLHSWCAGCNWI